MARDLKDQVIVITGASGGIGAATAVACAQAGMDVVLGARRVEKLEAVAAAVRQAGRKALVRRCDVDSDEDVQGLVDGAMETFGRLDVAYANAGYGLFTSVLQTTDEQVRQMFETNFHGTLRLLRSAGRVMLQQKRGHLLVCSSAASEVPLPMYGVYCATKAAQDSVVGALRAELSQAGVHVSSVHPIGTRSDFFDEVEARSGHPNFSTNTPGWLMQTPQQVAGAVVRCLRRPRAEVWPNVMTRYGAAVATAFPGLAAAVARRQARKRYS